MATELPKQQIESKPIQSQTDGFQILRYDNGDMSVRFSSKRKATPPPTVATSTVDSALGVIDENPSCLPASMLAHLFPEDKHMIAAQVATSILLSLLMQPGVTLHIPGGAKLFGSAG